MSKNQQQKLDPLRHSCAHLLAAAVLELWPDTHNAIGPSIENGFYQDFDFGKVKISEDNFPNIEQRMHEIATSWKEFEIKEVSVEQARKDFSHNPYKLELIEEFAQQGKTITENNPGNFLDLCHGRHIENPKENLKYFKLLSITGANWRGNEKNQMLARIYGTCFFAKKELDEYLEIQKIRKNKKDHKQIGREQELFFNDDIAPGAPFWLPKGMIIFKELEKYIGELTEKAGYQETSTPIMVKSDLFRQSGHFEKFGEHNMYNLILSDEADDSNPVSHTLKPMNCPESTILYRFRPRSYKELPIRYSEIGRLHRREKSGEVNGLLRVRQLTMDDAHIYATEDQVINEVSSVLDMMTEFYKKFGFEHEFRFATRPESRAGTDDMWDKAEKDLAAILKRKDIKAGDKKGDGAFYGPKIDVHIKDSLEREWQLATVQLDFHQPEAFKLTYIDNQGKEKRPVMIHRAIFGSFERFIAILTEQYQGAFPAWLSPLQVKVLPIADRHEDYSKKIVAELRSQDIRAELDNRSESLQAKIRDATLQKVPYIGIIGDKEVQSAKGKAQNREIISVRTRNGKDLGQIKLSSFLNKLKEEIDKKI